jgi:hypothetical protein
MCNHEKGGSSVSPPFIKLFLFIYTLNSVFLKALHFVKSGQYVNTARVDPAMLVVENSRLRIRDNNSLAICIMTGTLTESYIVDSCEAGPRSAPYAIHKVTIAPLEQDWRRDASVWGALFDFRTIVGMYSEAGFGFATRGEGKGDLKKNGMFIYVPTRIGLNSFYQLPHHLLQLKIERLPLS